MMRLCWPRRAVRNRHRHAIEQASRRWRGGRRRRETFISTQVAALWDNLKAGGKWQIIGFVGCLEFWRELQTYETAGKRDAHYMRGGLPGKYPDFEGPLPNLYWGLGAGKKTPEQLAKGRNAEINNGRLAMLGLFGFFAESKAPGSVPFLTQFDFPAYGGDFMQPFEGNFELFGGN